MKVKLKFAIEVKRSRPGPCDRRHAGDPPESLPSLTEATLERSPGRDYDGRSPAVAARFGFGPAASGERRRDRG